MAISLQPMNQRNQFSEVDFTPLDRNRIAEYNFPFDKEWSREVAPDPAFVSSYSPNDTRYAATFGYFLVMYLML
jgi:hypothetical protein